jgi:hypothetical protein
MSTLTNMQGIVYMLIFLKGMASQARLIPTLLFLMCLGALIAGCGPTTSVTPTPANGSPAVATANSSSAEATPTPEVMVTVNTTSVPLTDPVGDMVETYLQARVSSDEPTLRDLTCADQEKNISIHVNSFKGQDASLRDVQCTFDGTNKVSCTGEIVLVYDGEEQTRAPGSFTVVEEDGRWLWCGEAES